MKALLIISAVAISLGVAEAKEEKPVGVLDAPRYKENPIYLFFESYIQDVIGVLPPEKSKSIQEMNLQKVFHTTASEWKQVIREVLHLSDTTDTAILDLWYRNRKHYAKKEGGYDTLWFAQNFTDEYMKPDSKVDVWPEGALEAAKKRIAEARKDEKK